MTETGLSSCFEINCFFWKIFGLWPGTSSRTYYRYYSISYLFVTLFVYNILLTANLIYTPWKIEFLIREVIFIFTEVAVVAKVLTIILMRKRIILAFDLLDSEFFRGEDDISRKIVKKYTRIYTFGWKMYVILSNFSYSSQAIVPIIKYYIFRENIELPICKYYFLSDETRDAYFSIWLIYQAFGMYGHMMYNVNVDSFVAGLILMAVTQMKVINHKLTSLKLGSIDSMKPFDVQDNIQVMNLNKCLRHYDLALEYYKIIQEIINVMMFVQFGVASAIICVVLCGFLLPFTTEKLIFLVSYLFAMTSQIFVPAWLGTQLSYESQELVYAAYESDWISRSERFKRNIKIFQERTKKPLVLTGLKLFPLSLSSFTSIMKSAYSFFTLVLNLQNHENQ